MSRKPNTALTTGEPVTADALEIDPDTGMQKAYVVMTPEERAKGFVRPVRRTYVHVGSPPSKYPLEPLTDEQKERFPDQGYAMWEPYPESESPATGRYWTQEEIDRVGAGCGTATTMGRALAETYAADPTFYGATFCCQCRKHLPVSEFVWEGTNERLGS